MVFSTIVSFSLFFFFLDPSNTVAVASFTSVPQGLNWCSEGEANVSVHTAVTRRHSEHFNYVLVSLALTSALMIWVFFWFFCLTPGGLSKKPGQVCDRGVKRTFHLTTEARRTHIQRHGEGWSVCRSRLFFFFFLNAIFYSAVVYLTVAYYLYLTVFSQLWNHCLFIVFRKSVTFLWLQGLGW